MKRREKCAVCNFIENQHSISQLAESAEMANVSNGGKNAR